MFIPLAHKDECNKLEIATLEGLKNESLLEAATYYGLTADRRPWFKFDVGIFCLYFGNRHPPSAVHEPCLGVLPYPILQSKHGVLSCDGFHYTRR